MEHNGIEYFVYLGAHLVERALWPAAVIFVAIAFRKEIGRKVEHLIEVTILGNRAKFQPQKIDLKSGPWGKITGEDDEKSK